MEKEDYILVYEVLINFNNKKQTEETALSKLLPNEAQAPGFRSLTDMQELAQWSVSMTQRWGRGAEKGRFHKLSPVSQ